MQTKSGFIAIVGRPNVGKSTFLNKILGSNISITANKPQTTRHKILGIKTIDANQIIFIDTPGIHKAKNKFINKVMNKAAKSSVFEAEAILFVIEALKWTDEDELVLDYIKRIEEKIPVYLLINKVDRLDAKERLLPFLSKINNKFEFTEIFPISAIKDQSFNKLEKQLISCLSEAPHYFPKDTITDKNMAFRLQEIVREKLTRKLGSELPFGLTVQVEKITKKQRVTVIHAIIWLDKASHKPIVIGRQGAKLKEIGSLAREDMEKILATKVHLQLWIKIKSGWSNNSKDLQELGYLDEE